MTEPIWFRLEGVCTRPEQVSATLWANGAAGVEIQDQEGNAIGQITSGGFGPTVQAPVAMGYVHADHSAPGQELHLIIRGKPQPATVCALPFVPQKYKR